MYCKITVADLHELEWQEHQLEELKKLPDAEMTFIGEVVFENNEYLILRYCHFHENPFNLPTKNVGTWIPKSLIKERIELIPKVMK